MNDFVPAPGPAAGLIHVQDHMVVIAHDCVGGDVDGEDFAQQRQAVHEPGLAVVEILAGILVFAAQKSLPHAAGYAVVIGCVRQRDDL